MPQLAQRQTAQLVSAWLKDSTFDLSLIVGITLLAFGMAAATLISPRLFLPILTAHIWLFGYDHVLATYSKLAGLPEDRKRNRFLIRYLPPIVLIGVLAIRMQGGLVALNSLYFFWQHYHTTRQSWGIAQQYRHKAGGLIWDNLRLSEVTLWSVPIWGLLYRCHKQPDEFLYQDLVMPQVPLWLVQAAEVASITLVLLWIVTRIRAFYRGELALGHTLYMVSHFIVYFASYIAIDDINSGWLLVNVWHNAQYLAFVWMHNRQRFSPGVREDARLLSWLSQPGYLRAAVYYLSFFVVAGIFYTLLMRTGNRLDRWFTSEVVPLALIGSLTLNFHHYLVDGFIWKRPRQLALITRGPT